MCHAMIDFVTGKRSFRMSGSTPRVVPSKKAMEEKEVSQDTKEGSFLDVKKLPASCDATLYIKVPPLCAV